MLFALVKKSIIFLLIANMILSVTSQGTVIVTTNHEKKDANEENSFSILNENKVLILVDESIYPDLLSELSRFSDDITSAGFVCEIYHKKISYRIWDSPQAVKKFIIAHSSNLAGCILIGNIPIAEYRVKGHMNMYETFPCDFYYMDLDGKWDVYDEGGWQNGYPYTVFCNHTNGNGNVKPEIWIGRLSPDSWIGDKTNLLREYFERNHAYRTRKMIRSSRALLYIDDSWYSYANNLKKHLKNVYPSSCITVVKNKETTRAKDYLNRLKDNKYEWVQLHVHSDQWQHQFRYNNDNSYDLLTCRDLKKNYTGALFYDLYACSALDFSVQCLGNLYLFGQTSGLTVIGSSKVTNIGDEGKRLYDKLGEGKCIGEAFKYWYSESGVRFPSVYYGKLILGDPTLAPIKDTTPPDVEFTYPKEGSLYFGDRELTKINPTNDYDCIVIKPDNLKIQVTDTQTNVKTVNVIFDGVEHPAEKTSFNNIWSYPIINNNYYMPEIHSYQAKASDTLNNMGYSKERKICSIMGNSPPYLYGEIIGPTSGKTGNKYSYSIKLFDVEGDDVYYRFKWDDNTEPIWEGPVKTEPIYPNSFDLIESQLVTVEEEHKFKESGTRSISVEIKDCHGNQGLYSISLDIKIDRNRSNKLLTIQQLFNNWDFPLLTRLLNFQ